MILSRSAQTTRGYDRTRVIGISYTQIPSSFKAEITLHNAEGDLTSLDFEHFEAICSSGYATGVSRSVWVASTAYSLDDIVVPITANGFQYRCSIAGTSDSSEPTFPTDLGVIVPDNTATWEMDGNTGDEYSREAPLRVRVQELHSGRGLLRVILRAEGIPDQMAEDKAESKLELTAGDSRTAKTLITAIVDATLTPYSNYTSFTATYDSEDSLIDSYIPADYFQVSENQTRWDRVDYLLGHTGTKARPENDGKLHFLDPVTTGSTYAYEYKFDVSGDHTFWNKTIRLRFINPNKVVVKSGEAHEPQYTGSSTSSTSNALAPKVRTIRRKLVSDTEANNIAAAIIETAELDAERGFATVPMNVGQELWDFVNITDSRQGDTRTGNIQYLRRDIRIHRDRPMTWSMTISFGKVSTQSLIANSLAAGDGRLSNDQIFGMIEALDVNAEANRDKLNEVIDHINDHHELFHSKEILVTDILTIPGE